MYLLNALELIPSFFCFQGNERNPPVQLPHQPQSTDRTQAHLRPAHGHQTQRFHEINHQSQRNDRHNVKQRTQFGVLPRGMRVQFVSLLFEIQLGGMLLEYPSVDRLSDCMLTSCKRKIIFCIHVCRWVECVGDNMLSSVSSGFCVLAEALALKFGRHVARMLREQTSELFSVQGSSLLFLTLMENLETLKFIKNLI